MIGIVADDITGANDIGIMYKKAGLLTDVYPYEYRHDLSERRILPEVAVIDTNSRLDSKEEAYDKVFESTKQLMELGYKQFFNKTCSVFRGNIGAEFDAMLDALNESFAVVVLGFPKNGRTTIHQQHYVYGKKLDESNFRNDPVHPMTESNIVDILKSQTTRVVDHVDISVIREGYEAIKKEIQRRRNDCHYLILDVEDQLSLEEIAKAIIDEKVIAGASGVAEELARVSSPINGNEQDLIQPAQYNQENVGILCAAGSLTPQTFGQVAFIKEQGISYREMDTTKLFSDDKVTYLKGLIQHLAETVTAGSDALVYASNQPELVAKTKEIGKAKGFSNEEISRVVSNSLAGVVASVVKQTGVERILLAGGETSPSICQKLGIKGLRVHEEIEPGLPSCISIEKPHYVLVLKSGSFGGVDFFEKALNHLKEC
mgnify:CR=1 FL=1